MTLFKCLMHREKTKMTLTKKLTKAVYNGTDELPFEPLPVWSWFKVCQTELH